MSFLKTFTLAVCGLSVVGSVAMMLVPDRFRREMRAVIAISAFAAVAALVSGADFSDISSGLSFGEKPLDSPSYEQLVCEELEAQVADYIESFLKEAGIDCKKVAVGTTIDGQYRIFITEASLKLDPSEKDKEDLARALIKEKIGEIKVEISCEDG